MASYRQKLKRVVNYNHDRVEGENKMIQHKIVLEQLRAIGFTNWFFGRQEVNELSKILNDGEIIEHCAFGMYEDGPALLVATNNRLLLVDKRPFFLNLEDLRYEMINEVDFAGRFFDAVVKLHTGNKQVMFRSFAGPRLRGLYSFIQDQITIARHLEQTISESVQGTVSAEWRPYSLLQRRRIGKFSLLNSK
jgi:hypothetical protein